MKRCFSLLVSTLWIIFSSFMYNWYSACFIQIFFLKERNEGINRPDNQVAMFFISNTPKQTIEDKQTCLQTRHTIGSLAYTMSYWLKFHQMKNCYSKNIIHRNSRNHFHFILLTRIDTLWKVLKRSKKFISSLKLLKRLPHCLLSPDNFKLPGSNVICVRRQHKSTWS